MNKLNHLYLHPTLILSTVGAQVGFSWGTWQRFENLIEIINPWNYVTIRLTGIKESRDRENSCDTSLHQRYYTTPMRRIYLPSNNTKKSFERLLIYTYTFIVACARQHQRRFTAVKKQIHRVNERSTLDVICLLLNPVPKPMLKYSAVALVSSTKHFPLHNHNTVIYK